MALAMKNPHDWPGILQKISPSLGPSQWTSSIISHQNNKHPANYSIHTLELSKKHLDFGGPTSPRPGPQHRRAVRRVSVASIRASKKNRPSRRKNRQPTETIRTMGFFVDCLILFFWYVEIFLVWMDFYLACTLFFSLNGFIWVLNMGIFWSILAEIGIKKWHVPNFLWALHVWTYQNIVFIWV